MNYLKGGLAVTIAAFATYFQQLLAPVVMLLVVMVLDYVSGVAAAFVNKELCSRTGVIGIIKKVCYLLIVAVGIMVDYVIFLAGEQMGTDLTGYYLIALVIIVWLIINECISILENAAHMGLPVPSFVAKILERLKTEAEKKVNREQ